MSSGRKQSLSFAAEEDNDYEEGGHQADFIHVLQLEEDIDLNDIETVKSECVSQGLRKQSWTSEDDISEGEAS